MPTVLCLDRGSGRTRELVLSHSGYEVLHADNVHHAAELFRSSTIDAVVLDAGLSLSTLSPFATVLKMARPGIPVLLVADIAEEVEYEGATPIFDAVMSRLDGPEALLNRLHDLIAAAEQASKAGVQAASVTINRTQELRDRMEQLREKMRKTRDLSRELRRRKPPA